LAVVLVSDTLNT